MSPRAEPRTQAVDFVDDGLKVYLRDGHALTVPLEWFPRLRDASQNDRCNFELVDGGEEIRWPSLDEDLLCSWPARLARLMRGGLR